MKKRVLPYIRLARPEDWVKNLFVLLPIFFAGHLTHVSYWGKGGMAFLAFCLAAGGIYCINDIRDARADRRHPHKRLRPVAARSVTPRNAAILAATMAVAAVAMASLLPECSRYGFLICLGIYLLLNIAYTLLLKRVVLLDVTVIAVGFVLRVIGGGVATGIWVSQWIVMMTFLLALFLALGKRRDDALLFERTGKCVRPSIERYSVRFLNYAIPLTAAITVVCYIMYTMSPDVIGRMGTPYLYVTSLFVLGGILRYMQIVLVKGRGGNPVANLYRDRILQCCIAGWVLSFVVIIYLL